MCKLGVNCFTEGQQGFSEMVKSISKAGFNYVEFNLCSEYKDCKNEEQFFGERVKILKEHGLSISQAHAPAITHASDDPKDFTNRAFKDKIIASIRRAAIIGSPYLVMHLYLPYGKNKETVPYDYSKFEDENFKLNVDFCQDLIPYLKEYNVKLALENIVAYDWIKRGHAKATCCTSKECNAYIDVLGDEHFCICLDVGHLNLIAGETHDEFITNLNGRVKVLHLHDNFGALNDWFGELDRHLLPYYGCLQWDKLAQSLKKNNFDGVYSFEMNRYAPLELVDDVYNYIYKAGKKIFY